MNRAKAKSRLKLKITRRVWWWCDSSEGVIMKNQYFGDNRDLFKYDLILRVIKETGLINHFMLIPMLTENDDTGHGEDRDRKRASAGTKNKLLVKFLNKFEEKSKRDIEHLKSFFGKQDVEMTIYHGKNEYFSRLQSEEYFEQLKDKLLSKSLVFVDPDKGMQVGKSGKEHILYSEIETLYKRMGTKSILMIFQGFPRDEKHEEYLARKSKELKDKISGELPIYICDKKTIFFFLTRSKYLSNRLAKIISRYKRDYLI